MAESIVTLRVEARNAISSLNKTSQATKKLSTSAKGATTSLTAASTAAKGLGASLVASLGPLITLGAAVATVGNAIGTFTARERDIAILTQGLKNLGAGATELNELQKAADRLGNQTLFNQEEFTRGFNLLTSFRKIGVDSYERVAQAAADIAQVNQVDVNTSFMQLAKALQDPERNLSNLNRSGIAFTKTQTDVIKELMKTNKTADAHAMILKIVEESYNKLSQAAAEGFAGNVDSLGEAFRDFSETLGKALEPALIAATKGLTALIKAADDLLKSPLGKTIGLFALIAGALKTATVAFVALKGALLAVGGAAGVAAIGLNAIPFVAAATLVGAFTTKIMEAANKQRDFNKALKEGDEQVLKSEFNRLFIEKQKILKRINEAEESSNKKALQSLKRQLQIINESIAPIKQKLDKNRKITTEIDNQNEKLEENNKLTDEQKKNIEDFAKIMALLFKKDKERKEAFDKFLNKQKQEGELLQAAIDGNVEQVRLQHAINDAVAIHGEHNRQKITDELKANQALRDQKTEIDKNAEAAEVLKGKFAQIGQEIEDGIVQNLTDAVMGTQTLAQSAINVLEKMRRKLVEVALQKALAGIGGPIGGFFQSIFGFAEGGRPPVGRASIVGERGPELFVPSVAGTVIPNNQLGGGGSVNNVVVNVDASGTEVEGNDESSNQLGKLVGLAVQQELVKQQRAGGLLSKA